MRTKHEYLKYFVHSSVTFPLGPHIVSAIFSNVVSAFSSANVHRAVAELISLWPSTAEASTHFPTSACVICAGQNGTGSGFSPSKVVSIAPFCQCLIYLPLNIGSM